MSDFPTPDHNRIRRVPKRARYDRETVYAVWMRATWPMSDFPSTGVVSLRLEKGDLIPDPQMTGDYPVPESVQALVKKA